MIPLSLSSRLPIEYSHIALRLVFCLSASISIEFSLLRLRSMPIVVLLSLVTRTVAVRPILLPSLT